MHIFKVVATLQKATLVPEDAVQNTFHYIWSGSGSPVTSDFDSLADYIAAFYNNEGDVPATAAIRYAMSQALATDADFGVHPGRPNLIDFYDLPDTPGPIGAPAHSYTWSLGPVHTTDGVLSLPDEVAVCLSWHSNLGGLSESTPGGAPGPSGDIHPRARHRNRCYIGPLNTVACSSASGDTDPQRVPSGLRDNICAAAKQFLKILPADAGWTWGAWSKTRWTADLVTGVFCDDAFDIQRRRGLKPTTRTEVTF